MRVSIELVCHVCRDRVSFAFAKQAESFYKRLPLIGEQFLESRHEVKEREGILVKPLDGLRQFSFFKKSLLHVFSSV